MSWEPINLAKLEERPQTLPTIGGVGLVYPGKRHLFSGPPESAKTLAAYAIALEEIRAGGTVLLIDFEMGQWDARDRLREMGATDDDLERFLYVEPETPASRELIEALVDNAPLTLVIIDAAAGAYGLQGLDDNVRRDVEAFAQLYVQTFWLRDVASIVLDHVTKNADKRGDFAIGSERKVGGVDVHLGFEAVLKLSRGGRGLYKVTTKKDRLGHLQRPKAGEVELRSDPVTHALTWTFKHAEPPTADTPWQPTRLMEKASRYLESTPPDPSGGVSRSEVRRGVTGTNEYIDLAVDALIVEGYAAETAGPRGSRLVHSVKPYRESTASAPRRDPAGTGSVDLSDDPAVSAPPLGADGVGEVDSNGDTGWQYLVDETSSPLVTHARRDCPEIPPVAVLRSVLIPFGSHAPATWRRCERCGGARLIGQDDW